MGTHNKHITLVYDAIIRYASEKKPINAKEILQRIISNNPEDKCERKTIQRALDHLRTKYGMDEDGNWIDENTKLHYSTVKRKTSMVYKNYWFEICSDDNIFTDEELLYLIDAVQFSKHISHNYATEIIKKLVKQSQNEFNSIFEKYSSIDKNYHTIKKDFFINLGDITHAIHAKKMITFYETQYVIDNNLHTINTSQIKATPINIVIVDGNYHLLFTTDNSDIIRSIRIDRISELRITDETGSYSIESMKIMSNPEKFITEHRFLNTKIGKVIDVTLKIDKSILGEVLDSFGTEIQISSNERSSNCLTVNIKSSEQDALDWAIRYGEHCVILEPNYLRNQLENKALLLSNSYVDDDRDKHYNAAIKWAEKNNWLVLNYIDLNNYDSYKNLENIQYATFRRNWINDFSFLKTYSNLESLYIENNTIQDPGCLSKLVKLERLGLQETGITNLEFITNLQNLRTLSLRESTLENVDALYSLKRLNRLYVNKTTSSLIDRSRLTEVFGDSFRYRIDETNGLVSRHKRTY